MSHSTESGITEGSYDHFSVPAEALNWGDANSITGSALGGGSQKSVSDHLVIEENEDSLVSMEPLNILYYMFDKLCKQYKIRKGTGDLKNIFGYWTDQIGLENTRTYPEIKVINLRNAYLGAEQLMVLADILRVETVETTRASSKAALRIKSMNRPPTSFKMSRVPEVLAISLRDMALDYSVDERVKFMPLSTDQTLSLDRLPTIKVSGNEALRYFLSAVSGHPSLEVLDLSYNQIGAHMVPALSKFIKATPSLIKIKLQHTLLNEGEIERLNAQCLLNQMRIEAQNENRRLELQEIWKMMEVDWLHGVSEKLLKEYIEEISQPVNPGFDDLAAEHIPPKIPPIFQSQSPHVSILEPPGEVVDALERFHRKNSLESDSLLLDRPSTTAGATHRLDALAVGKAERYSQLFNTPYLRYYKGHEKDYVLSPDAEDILRSAFVDPHTAEMTFLCGRKPCPSLPTCKTLHSSPKDVSLRLKLKEEISGSLLLSAAERVLFPKPPKPKRCLKGIGETDPNLRTTAEENYMFIVENQERQWNDILDKLVDHMEPAYFYDGDVIYKEGELPYWLWFLPPEPSGHSPIGRDGRVKSTEVLLQSNVTPYGTPCSSATESSSDYEEDEEGEPHVEEDEEQVSLKVKAGEFFGDRELFGATALYIYQHSRMTNEKLDLGLLREKYKYREGSAILLVNNETQHYNSTMHRSMSSVLETPRSGKKKVKHILVWQIPFEVALFYLFEPYQRFHLQAAQAMQSLPTTRDLHPSIAAMLGYILHPVGITAGDLSKLGKSAEGGGKRHILAQNDEILTTTFILEEGEFVFGALSVYGKWSEKQLQGGTVVTNSNAYNHDAKARQAQQQNGVYDTYQPPQIVGKSAAMRQFREHKRRAKKYSKTSTPLTALTTDFPVTQDQEYMLGLGMQSSHWRYYTIKNKDWFNLPEDIRLALSKGCIVAGQKE